MERDAYDRLDTAYRAALTRFSGENFDDLSEAERILVTLYGLEAEVNNGGFDQYFFNGAGDQAFFAPTALEKVGARAMAALAARANAVFGAEGPPPDRDQRQDALLGLAPEASDALEALDTEFFRYPDDLDALVLRYVETHAPQLLERDGQANELP